MRRLVGSSTEIIDAAGGTVMAGIHDGHMHALPAAEQSLSPSLDNAELTVPELQASVAGDARRDQRQRARRLAARDQLEPGCIAPGTTRSPTSCI